MADITTRIEEQVSAYRRVKEAIGAKEKERAEIFEIERAAHSLAALVEAQRRKRDEFEQQMEARKEELEQEIGSPRAAWGKMAADHKARAKEQAEKLRRREQEEYEYTQKREREQKTNALQDEISRLEREAAVAQTEKRLVDLEVQVEKFPKELNEAVKRAVKETTERLSAEATRSEELLRKTY